jgi:hypothetical protein
VASRRCGVQAAGVRVASASSASLNGADKENHMRTRVIYAAIAMALTGAAVTSNSAHADSSCTTLISNVKNQLIAHGGAYHFDLTIHRTDIDEVEYSRGDLWLYSSTGYWALTGGNTYQLFRDRYNGNQPFNYGAADTITPYVSTDGQLYIWSNTWSFSTQWDLSCTGNTMTRIVPNVGVVTLTFRNWWIIG